MVYPAAVYGSILIVYQTHAPVDYTGRHRGVYSYEYYYYYYHNRFTNRNKIDSINSQ